jgi:hypothetical protein
MSLYEQLGRETKRRTSMRTRAMSILTAAGLAIAVSAAIPASAEEGVTVGIGPGGLGVGVHERDRDRDWRHHYARDRDDVVIRRERPCRVTVIHEEGMTKRIKRCD